MICTICGKEFEGNFCANCGAPADTKKHGFPLAPLGQYKGAMCMLVVENKSILIQKKLPKREYRILLTDIADVFLRKNKIGGFLCIRTKDNMDNPIPGYSYNSSIDPYAADFSASDTEKFTKVYEFLQIVSAINKRHMQRTSPPVPDKQLYEDSKVKICLHCGERLLSKAAHCPICDNKSSFAVIDREDQEQIRETIETIRNGTTYSPPATPAFVRPSISKEKPLSKRDRIKDNKQNAVACCPNCGSTSLSANKKGFGIGKAVVGSYLVGPLGLVAGNAGARKVWVTCLNCGKRWKL